MSRQGSTRANAEAEYADLLARAEADPDVVGLIVFGSRGFDAYLTEASDYDVMVIVLTEPDPWRTPHGSGVEAWPMTLEEFRGHALAGSPQAWNRPTFLGVRVILDKLDGEIAAIAAAKTALDPDESRARAAAALDDYVNSLYRSLRQFEAGRRLEGRLDALESLSPLLSAAFALERRVRPFNKWLLFELERRPLSIEGLLEHVDRVSAGPTAANQRALFRLVEASARARGQAAVIDSWEPDVEWLRGAEAPAAEPPAAASRMSDHD